MARKNVFWRPLQSTERDQFIFAIRPQELQVLPKRGSVVHLPHTVVVSRRRHTQGSSHMSALMVSTTLACLFLASSSCYGVLILFLKSLLAVHVVRSFIRFRPLKRGVQERNKYCLPIVPSFLTPITPA